jgi:acetylornithine/succinyldiaminopimelate/putrescine aminotransferase
VLLTNELAKELKPGDLGTTFGGGPMACAVVKAVIETIIEERLLDRVREVSAVIRETCVVGPVTAIQGAGFLLGLKTRGPAAAVRDRLLAKNILVGTSADPNVLRMLPPLILDSAHARLLATTLEGLSNESI